MYAPLLTQYAKLEIIVYKPQWLSLYNECKPKPKKQHGLALSKGSPLFHISLCEMKTSSQKELHFRQSLSNLLFHNQVWCQAATVLSHVGKVDDAQQRVICGNGSHLCCCLISLHEVWATHCKSNDKPVTTYCTDNMNSFYI